MTDAAILELKQRLSQLSETERRKMAAYLLKLKHESPSGRKKTTRIMQAMDAGNKHRLSDLKIKLGHG